MKKLEKALGHLTSSIGLLDLQLRLWPLHYETPSHTYYVFVTHFCNSKKMGPLTLTMILTFKGP